MSLLLSWVLASCSFLLLGCTWRHAQLTICWKRHVQREQETKEAGYTRKYVLGLKAAGYSCREARAAGYSWAQCAIAGYSLQDGQELGFPHGQEMWDHGEPAPHTLTPGGHAMSRCNRREIDMVKKYSRPMSRSATSPWGATTRLGGRALV